MIYKRLHIVICAVAISVLSLSFTWFSSESSRALVAYDGSNAVTYHFGFSIQPSANTGLISYAIIGERDGQVVSKQPLSLINFILQVKGDQYSVANPFHRNFFKENQLDSCFYYYDLIKDVYGGMHCFSIDDLWVLRYSKNPLCGDGCIPKEGMRTEGWSSGRFKPNELQMTILQSYGVVHFNQFIYGEAMFRLFKDMADETWQENYKAAGITVAE